ncbi:MAG: hypothetical protein NUV53_03740 [Patescibacteria group bacterium]|nr:hypothetical protein [Patescibacteria group bacterium]
MRIIDAKKHIVIGAALLANSIFFTGIFYTSAAPPQTIPLIDGGSLQKLPDPIRNFIQSGINLNNSVSQWTPPLALSGRGERISNAAQGILRSAISVVITAISWIIVVATQAIMIVAGITIHIIHWIIEAVRL